MLLSKKLHRCIWIVRNRHRVREKKILGGGGEEVKVATYNVDVSLNRTPLLMRVESLGGVVGMSA